MSINTTFHPLTETIVVDNTAAAQIKGAAQRGVSTFRVRALVASGYLAWGVAAPAAPSAPGGVGIQPGNVIGVTLGQPVCIEVPPNSFFIGDKAFLSGAFEITGGIGGVLGG